MIGIDYERTADALDFTFVQRDIFQNGFRDGSFDIVLSFDVIEHVMNPEELLREIRRLLSDGGVCVLSTPNRLRVTAALLCGLGLRRFPYCIDPLQRSKYPEYWHLREYTIRELRSLVKSIGGLNIVEEHRVFYGHRFGVRSLFGLPWFHNSVLVFQKNRSDGVSVVA